MCSLIEQQKSLYLLVRESIVILNQIIEMSVSVHDCHKQLEEWAEREAKNAAKETEQGKYLSYLEALKDKAIDEVKEANVSDELKGTLNNLFAFVNITWSRKLPPRPKQIASR